MVKIYRVLFGLLAVCCLVSAPLYAAGVKATVDTVEVVKGNPVTLYIKATGGAAAFPDIQKVGDAPVTRSSTSTSRNLSMVNGKVTSEMSITKVIQFVPEHDMTIPSYKVNIAGTTYATDPIEIRVVKSNAPVSNNGALFTLRLDANKKRVRVGESLVVTVYFALRHDVQLSQDVQYTQPDFAEFIAVQSEEKNAYIKGNYQIQEVQYILTATKEGNFTIGAAQAKIGVPDMSRRDIFGMSFGTKWYQSASNTVDIEVLPQSKDVDMIGSFKARSTIDRQETKANKPVNLTVTIEGKGNLESFEYPEYEIDGVTVYSDDAKIDTKVVDGEIYSIYSKTFAFISDADFHIPKRHFSMLDIKTDSIKELTIQGYDIKVRQDTTSTPLHTLSQSVVHTSLPQSIEPKAEAKEVQSIQTQSVVWWMLLLAFVLGALSMYLLRLIPLGSTKSYKESDALKILYAHMGEDAEVEEMVRKLYAKKRGDKSVEIDKKRLKALLKRYS